MQFLKKIPRSLQLLVVIAILATLVWRFSPPELYYLSIMAAVAVAAVFLVLIYRSPRPNATDKVSTSDQTQQEEKTDSEEAETEAPVTPFARRSSQAQRLEGTEVAARYFKMAAASEAEEKSRNSWSFSPPSVENVVQEAPASETEEVELPETAVLVETPRAAKNGEPEDEASLPPIPLIIDESVLTEDEKSDLENAVWYRCENPFCKFTHFLEVHHIVEEKEGGSNKLENLIVLCPYCHDLAHRHEIPEEEMRNWISNREERFKIKIMWKY